MFEPVALTLLHSDANVPQLESSVLPLQVGVPREALLDVAVPPPEKVVLIGLEVIAAAASPAA